MLYQSIRSGSFFSRHRFRAIASILPSTSSLSSTILQRPFHTQHQQQRHYKVLFFGSDHFSVPSLAALLAQRADHSHPIQEVSVVTSFAGTDNAVRKYLKTASAAADTPTHSWPLHDSVALCSRFDVGVVVSFGHLIPEPIIEAFPLGMINVHASLLPRWRGAAPIIHALLNGDRQTGVSIMRIRPRHFDVGELLAQRAVPIGERTMMPELHAALAAVGAELLVDTMRDLDENLRRASVQDERLVLYAPKVTEALALVDWSAMTAQRVYDLYRALFGFKRLQTNWRNETIRIVEMVLPVDGSAVDVIERPRSAGTVEFCRKAKCLRIWCADGRCVNVLRLSVVGKRTFTAAEFNNGYLRRVVQDRCVENGSNSAAVAVFGSV